MSIRDHVVAGLAPDLALAPDLGTLIDRFADAGIAIAREVRRAALTGHTGYAGGVNVAGERQKKLDVLGNEIVLEAFAREPLVASVISEEDDQPVATATPGAPYVVCTDPIDGSANTDVAGPVGTIFSICRRREDGRLPQGDDILAAGYILYGPSTVFALAAGRGASAFTLDEDRRDWTQTHPVLRCPDRGKTFSANLGHQREWHPRLRAHVDWMTESDRATGRPYSLRYIGALVADLHRCLIDGGFYFYPPDRKNAHGKLRLLYECAPLAFLAEAAGGRASTGERRVLEVEATTAHQRCPLVIGSAADVARYEQFMSTGQPS